MKRNSILLGCLALMMAIGVVASDAQKEGSWRERRRMERKDGSDGQEKKGHGHKKDHKKKGKKHGNYHIHKWKGNRKQKGKDGGWKKGWHDGHDFEKHASHVWHKYGWFWDAENSSWYQCTPVEDPERGYGCEYKGKWYAIKKDGKGVTPAAARGADTAEEDIVEAVETTDDNDGEMLEGFYGS